MLSINAVAVLILLADGQVILAIAIVVTAPLGLFLIRFFSPRLLQVEM